MLVALGKKVFWFVWNGLECCIVGYRLNNVILLEMSLNFFFYSVKFEPGTLEINLIQQTNRMNWDLLILILEECIISVGTECILTPFFFSFLLHRSSLSM
jgi:hypothetical protein